MTQRALQLYRKLVRDDIAGVAAQLAYYLLLSFFPFLIALLSLFSIWPVGKEIFLHALNSILPQTAYDLILQNLDLFSSANGGLLSIGFLGSLWIASKGSKAIMRCLNTAYRTENARPFWKNYLISVVLTLALALFIVLSVGFFLLSDTILSHFALSQTVLFLFSQLRTLLLFVILVVLMVLLYWLVPAKPLRFRQVVGGALLAAVLWVVCNVGFEIYVSRFRDFANIYGTLGGFIILLLWLYLISFSLLLGNEMNSFFILDTNEK